MHQNTHLSHIPFPNRVIAGFCNQWEENQGVSGHVTRKYMCMYFTQRRYV